MSIQLLSVCLSACISLAPTGRTSWNFILMSFMKICCETSYIRNGTSHFIVSGGINSPYKQHSAQVNISILATVTCSSTIHKEFNRNNGNMKVTQCYVVYIVHLRQQCYNSKFAIFQEKRLKVLKCYNFLWVQRRHNCSPVASFANCVMTLHLLKCICKCFFLYQ